MRIVTGIGPRVGSSFVMKSLRDSGLPVIGRKFWEFTAKDENPDGYWEPHPIETNKNIHTNKWKNKVIKIWPSVLLKTPVYNIDRMVVLERRNRQRQDESVIRVEEKEQRLIKFYNPFNPVTDLIDWSRWCLSRALEEANYPILRVYTEDLSGNINDVIKFMEK
tara:strand:+ start:1607 stop:2098 length:492 start_codon:yes stop_codon:yes gene_type:complete